MKSHSSPVGRDVNIVTEDLKKRIIQGTLFVLAGDGLSQALRLIGNLILTRLLVPEMFGLMAIANVLLTAFGLFSDIGSGPAVIRSKRGLEPAFLNTAWTMNVLRGAFLWLLTILAAFPAAGFYEQPILVWVVPILGFSFVLDGLDSMATVTVNKKLQMGRLTIMKLGVQCCSVFIMIVLAYFYKNVWALVIGGIAGACIRLIWSYQLDKEIRHRFVWDRSVASELFHFGKWIFLSTAMMFLATQADRLLLGKLFPLALFGVYSIAAGFAELPKNIVSTLSSTIIFPVISLYAHLEPAEIRKKILEKRKLILLPLALLVAVLCGFGDLLMNFLYDDRYHEAEWILPLLALGMWPLLLYATIDRCLYVFDNPRYPAIGNCLKFFYMIIFLPLSYIVFGKLGAVLVVAFNDLPVYLAINFGLARKGLSGLAQDMGATLILFFFLFAHFHLSILCRPRDSRTFRFSCIITTSSSLSW